MRGGQIREFKNFAKIIIIIALLSKNENSRILKFVKSPKMRNSRKFKHAKMARSTVIQVFTHLKLCFATATHNFKWVKNKHMSLWTKICKYWCLNTHFVPNDTNYFINPLTAKLFNLNFHLLEDVSRWHDPQLQVSENYLDLTKWRSTLFKSCWLMSHFIFNIFKMWDLMCK